MENTIIFADSSRGQYIPQFFAESHNPEFWRDIDPDDLAILRSGPETEFYWDAWESVLNNAETTNGMSLHMGESGDLFVVDLEGATEQLNNEIESAVEYEEFHQDSADNYAHLVGESWSESDTQTFADSLRESGIETHGNDIDQICDLALDNFTMVPDHAYSMGCEPDSIYLVFFPIGEIEIDLRATLESDLAFDLVRDNLDAHVSGDGLAYVGSDRGFAAVIKKSDLRDLIDAM